MTLSRRAAVLAFVLGVGGACADEFAPDPAGGFAAAVAESWPRTLLLGDTVTLRVAVTDRATGIGVAPAGIEWTVEPVGALARVHAAGDSAVFLVAAIGGVELTASLRDPAFDTASATAELGLRLAGAVLLAPEQDTLRSLGDTLVLRVRGVDANGAPVRVPGWSWSVPPAAPVVAVDATDADSARVVAVADGVATIGASHALCAPACSVSIGVGVRQTPASLVLDHDSTTLAALSATTLLSATLRDARGSVVASASGLVWDAAEPGVVTVVAGATPGQAVVTAVGNGVTTVRARHGTLVDSVRVRVRQEAVEVVALAGSGQSGVVGAPLVDSVRVEVRDARSHPVANAVVTWSALNGGAIAGSAATGTDGRAAARWTLGPTAGAQSAAAVLAGGDTARFDAVAQPGPAASIEVAPDSIRLESVGQTASVSAAVRDAFGNAVPAPVGFHSTAPSVAAADPAGTVTALANGTAWIVGTSGGLVDSVRVVVALAPASLTLSIDSLRFESIGASSPVNATIRDAGGAIIADPSGIVWETTSPAAAVAATAGDSTRATITAVSNGVAFVRARLGTLIDEVAVTVDQVVASAIAVAGNGQSASAGATLADSIRVEARDSRGNPVAAAAVTWSVLSGGGAVSGSGTTGSDGRAAVAWTLGPVAGSQQARAVVAGTDTAVFTATAAPGSAASLTITPANAVLGWLGKTVQASATVRDAFGNAVAMPVTWSSTSGGVASVGPSGTVTALANGTAAIVASAGGLADTMDVVVSQLVATMSMSLGADTLAVGDTLRLVATPRDSGGSVSAGEVIAWTSTDTTVASVDPGGRVTARARGTATIRATADGVSGSTVVTVAAWALLFDGNDFVQVAHAPALDVDSVFTLEAWVRPDAAAGTSAVVAMWSGSKAGSAWGLYLNGLVPTARFQSSTGNTVTTLAGPAAVPLGSWSHVALVFDRGTASILVNGVVVATQTGVPALNDPAVPLRFGADAAGSPAYLTGALDEIRLWGVARAASDVQATMNGRMAVPTLGLRAYWPLIEGTGDPVGVVGGLIGVRGGAVGDGAAPAWTLQASPVP